MRHEIWGGREDSVFQHMLSGRFKRFIDLGEVNAGISQYDLPISCLSPLTFIGPP